MRLVWLVFRISVQSLIERILLLSGAWFPQCNVWEQRLCLDCLFVPCLSCDCTLSLFIQLLVGRWSFWLFLTIAENLARFVGAHFGFLSIFQVIMITGIFKCAFGRCMCSVAEHCLRCLPWLLAFENGMPNVWKKMYLYWYTLCFIVQHEAWEMDLRAVASEGQHGLLQSLPCALLQ